MRYLFAILFLVLFQGGVRAAPPLAGQQLRSVELQRQAEEDALWLKDARGLFFDRFLVQAPSDPDREESFDRIILPYKDRFLSQRNVDELCVLVRALFDQGGHPVQSFSCGIENGCLMIRVFP